MDSRGTIRALVALLVAVVFGGVAVVALFQLITTYQARIDEARKPEDTVMVIVASRDLYPGVTITEDDLVAVVIQPRFLAGGVFLSPEHVVGQRPRERILANEFVRASRLANPESGEGLNAIIPREMRAISVEVANGAALSGFLEPGNYVDVLVTIDPNTENKKGKEVETHTLLQAVFVLGVNSKAQNEQMDASSSRGNKKPSITLLVTAQQAEQLAHAEAMGNLRLALRNDLDNNFVESQGASVAELLGILKKQDAPRVRKKAKPVPKAEPAPVEPETTGVLIIQGTKTKVEEVTPD